MDDAVPPTMARRSYELSSSVLSKLAAGTVMEWAAQAETGSRDRSLRRDLGPVLRPGHVFRRSGVVDVPVLLRGLPEGPGRPTMPADHRPFGPTVAYTSGTPEAVGSPVQFTIAQAPTGPVDPPAEFVWGFDQTPPTSGTIPAAQTCTTTVAESNCTEMTKNSSGLESAIVTIRCRHRGRMICGLRGRLGRQRVRDDQRRHLGVLLDPHRRCRPGRYVHRRPHAAGQLRRRPGR